MTASDRTLLELLDELGGLDVELRRSDAALAVALVATTRDRKILIVERTYRDGVCCIVDPTSEEIESAGNGDLWKIWNSERAVLMSGVV
jgi:hypothetical protein